MTKVICLLGADVVLWQTVYVSPMTVCPDLRMVSSAVNFLPSSLLKHLTFGIWSCSFPNYGTKLHLMWPAVLSQIWGSAILQAAFPHGVGTLPGLPILFNNLCNNSAFLSHLFLSARFTCTCCVCLPRAGFYSHRHYPRPAHTPDFLAFSKFPPARCWACVCSDKNIPGHVCISLSNLSLTENLFVFVFSSLGWKMLVMFSLVSLLLHHTVF